LGLVRFLTDLHTKEEFLFLTSAVVIKNIEEKIQLVRAAVIKIKGEQELLFLHKTEKRNEDESGCLVSPCTKPRE
jgi:hypothetical protein